MAELGEELRRERVRRNLTFKDVEQVLHIKTTYLEAIEDGKYHSWAGLRKRLYS